MRGQTEAAQDAMSRSTDLVDDLQDADAPLDVITKAEELQRDVSRWIGEEYPSIVEVEDRR